MVTDWGRGQYSRPPHHWQVGRSTSDHIPDDGRFYEPEAIRPPPTVRHTTDRQNIAPDLTMSQTISRALREHCNINAQSYFLAVMTDDGQMAYFSGPQDLPTDAIPNMFNMEKFMRYQKRASSMGAGHEDAAYYDEMYQRRVPGPHGRRGERRRDHGIDRSDEDVAPTYRRKRQRATLNRRGLDDEEPAVITRTKKGIKVGNSDEVWDFYGQRFRNIQQNACKLIAKIWVKAVAPKKQTHNPYTAGDEKAPDWWPKPWGPTKDDKVRHVEPDHLLKKERVHLLIHILRLIVEPNASQHPDIQKLNLNVTKLEELTMESLSGFFNDNGKGNNSKKKPYLKEIFKVARHEEQYKRGEIDASTEVFVMSDDKNPDDYPSDDELALAREDDGNEVVARPTRVSPSQTTGPHSIMSGSSSAHSPATNLQGPSFLSDLPVRGPPYPQPMMPQDLGSGQHSYVESGNMGVTTQSSLQSHSSLHTIQDMIPSPHDSSRRPSLFNSPASEFPAPGGSNLYPGGWQQGTTAPANTALYAFNTQQQAPQQAPSTFVSQQGVSLNQSPQYLSSQYGLPHPADVFRSNNVNHSPVPHATAYQNYLPHDGRPIPNNGLKLESLNRGPLQ